MLKPKTKVLIAAGGSGGHLFPAQTVAKELSDCQVLFAGHKLGSSLFFDRNISYQEIVSSNRNLFILFRGVLQSLRLIFRFQPDVVVGFGSFHSLPLLLAAFVMRKKIVLFEANCSFGKVNQLLFPFAKKTALQFPFRKGKKIDYVPLLPWNQRFQKIEKTVARKFYGLQPDLFTILVFGGSQGAKFINDTFYKAAKLLDFPFQVIHLTGKENPPISYEVPSVVKPFEEQMHYAYSAADMAVCRCGAGTTAELIRFQIPSVVIPYPYAHDHQRKNGEFLKKGTRILLQKDANAEKLSTEIQNLRQCLQMHKEAIQNIELPQTTLFSEIIRNMGK
jgi:UDP-N-acetylglucosamine--N-acetylmuramyl-(pentapeptide) pyrophosphoryl-undecaprenol N-acetylglucosamine transferase